MDYSDLVYISEELGNSLSRTQVTNGDIVISQRGSLGQCAIIEDTFEKLNISANIIAIKNIKGTTAEFIQDYILSSIGQMQLERSASGQVQQKITTQDISDILIPVNCDEKNLTDIIKTANNQYNEKIKKADNLIAISKKQLFEGLGIDIPPFVPTIFSCAKSKELLSMGWYCNSHSFYLDDVFRRIKESSYYVGTLEDYAYINPSINKSSLTDSTPVSFVPMNAVSEKTNSATYELTEYSNVKTGFTPFQKNDLLWAKITPCMQNGKSFFADNLPTQYGFASTEFYVIRAKRDDIYMPFLWCILSNDSILEAAQGMFSGSAGQQRVSETFLKKLPIALPSIEVQKELADNVMNALKKSKKLRNEAEQDWIAAKSQFEKDLLGE